VPVNRPWLDTIVAAAVLALTLGPVGIAVVWLGFIGGESPCVICWEQRIGMALLALIGLFVLRYGPRPRYLGLAVLVAVYGLFMSLRHLSLHAARDIGQGFGREILGIHTYSWALLIFWLSALLIGALLMTLRAQDLAVGSRTLRPLGRLAGAVFLVVIAANLVQALVSVGPPPFMGQSDPVRFSLDPRHWVWSLEWYRPAEPSWRGPWDVDRPDLDAFDPDPGQTPIMGASALEVRERRALPPGIAGSPTGLDYDASADAFLLTTEAGVALLDGALSRIRRSAIVDMTYSVDLGRFAGAAVLDDGDLLAVTENKSFVVLRAPAGERPARTGFRFFRSGLDAFDEVRRGRFATVRARQMYVMSVAYDPTSRSIWTVSVPNAYHRAVVLSRFARDDLTLSEERVLALGATSGLGLRDGGALAELAVTASTLLDQRLYALSAAGSTLLEIDLGSGTIQRAWVIPGLVKPAGMAVRGDTFVIVTADAQLLILDRPDA
jgi:disulfide bond formation protein DsbB